MYRSDILIFSLDIMTFTLKNLSMPLFANYKWKQLHIVWVYQPNRGPEQCEVILTLKMIFDLDVINFTLKLLSNLLLISETIHTNCFIFSEHINLIWRLCTVRSF